ncbi:MAG: 1,4-dihydroxy-2-naphthoate polyprenyltransferase [Actinomycetota bacterium]|nr:1,4-dihydroxy-2-naphthoate polyprenyltransferase [Actinomycetota bacterium]
MAKSTVQGSDVLSEIGQFSHAVLSFVDERGYPLSVATGFRADASRGTIELDRPGLPETPQQGSTVGIVFSSVRPYPGVGYDQRRYINVVGTVTEVNGSVHIHPDKVHGWDEERMSFFELCERSVPAGHRYMQKLSQERSEPVKPRLSAAWLFFLATRVPFLTATFVPILLGAVVARANGFSAWWYTVLALIGGIAIHLGLNVANDVFDSTSGADYANVNPTMYSGGSRMIQYGLVSLQAMKATSIACYALGIAIGLFLAATRGWGLLWIGVAGVFLSIFYTGPPLRLVHRGLGEICVALGFGPIMVLGSYFVVAQHFSWEAFYASLPVGLLIMLVLYVNQVPDRPADEKAGKRTIVVRLGKNAIVMGYVLSVAAAAILIVVGALTGVISPWTLIALPGFWFAFKVYKSLTSYYESPYELMEGMGQNILLHLTVGALLVVGYMLAIIF